MARGGYRANDDSYFSVSVQSESTRYEELYFSPMRYSAKIEYLRKLACFQILGGLHVRSHASGNSLEVTIANRHAVS